MNARCRYLASSVSLTAILVVTISVGLRANPTEPVVVSGGAKVSSPSANLVKVTQTSQKAIIDWRTFNVAFGETVNFQQPNQSAITLNRVTGGDPSVILGSISANGQVWLINQNGIAFGKSARVDVTGLVATTLNIKNSDFMAGDFRFETEGSQAGIVSNAGSLTISGAGLAALVAPNVQNSGLIRAHLGNVALASASGFTLDLYGDGSLHFLLGKATSANLKTQVGAVSNSGSLIADGGSVLLTSDTAKLVIDQAINMDGYIQARSVGGQAGTISLLAGGGVSVSGTLDASGERGGGITVTGHSIDLASTAVIDASGTAGGGLVRVGGDYQGRGDLQRAQNTSVASGALIRVNATHSGDAGRAIIWSDNHTDFAGTIDATGGAFGGDGGFVEVSGHNRLDYNGVTDLRAADGKSGTLLLDPRNVIISSSGTTPALPASGASTFSAASDDSVLQVSTLQAALGLGNVIVTTGSTGSQAGDITVASNVSWANGSNLTLSAHRNVIVADGATIKNTGSGNLDLRADNTGSGIGTVTFNGTGKVDYAGSTGLVSIFYNPTSYTMPTSYAANVSTNAAVTKQLTAYMLVNNLDQLRLINTNLTGRYALGRDIDASASATSPFVPIGEFNNATRALTSFSGQFDGQSNTIKNLTISPTGGPYFGMFMGNTGSIQNLKIVDLSLDITTPSTVFVTFIGGLVADNSGLINNISISGKISSPNDNALLIGGLVGLNRFGATVSDTYANVTTSGGDAGDPKRNFVGGGTYYVGGLVAQNIGRILRSSASGNISGNAGSLGGLVGINSGSIEQSFATGNVTNIGTVGRTRIAVLGGLTGRQASGKILNSYSTGSVTGDTNSEVAGLAGSIGDGSVTNEVSSTFSSGLVTTASLTPAHGLIGFSNGGGITISNSYWDTQSSRASTSFYGIGLSTAQLKSGLPSGFDTAVWAIDPAFNNGYPYLKWQRPAAVAVPTAVSFGVVAVTPTPTPVPTPTPTPVPTPTPTPSPTPTPVPTPTPFPTPTPVPTPVPIVSTPAGILAVVQTDRTGLVFYGPARPAPLVRPGYNSDGSSINLWAGGLSREDAAGAALDYAYLANAAYGEPGDVSTGFSNWKLERSWYGILNEAYGSTLTPEQYARLEKRIASSGLSATLYQKDGKYVLAFRGTEGGSSFVDLATDLNQILGFKEGGQYEFAKLIGELVTKKYGAANVTFTGHSLGGGLAQYASATNASHPNSVTFNAAGIGGMSALTLKPRSEILNIIVKGDPVSPFGRQLGGQTYQFDNPIANPTPLDYFGGYQFYAHTGSGGNQISIQALQDAWFAAISARR